MAGCEERAPDLIPRAPVPVPEVQGQAGREGAEVQHAEGRHAPEEGLVPVREDFTAGPDGHAPAQERTEGVLLVEVGLDAGGFVGVSLPFF